MEDGMKIYNMINANTELEELEAEGFLRGEEAGKTMDVPFVTVVQTLLKQNADFFLSYLDHRYRGENVEGLKRCLADIRNAAGCCFLKLVEEEE